MCRGGTLKVRKSRSTTTVPTLVESTTAPIWRESSPNKCTTSKSSLRSMILFTGTVRMWTRYWWIMRLKMLRTLWLGNAIYFSWRRRIVRTSMTTPFMRDSIWTRSLRQGVILIRLQQPRPLQTELTRYQRASKVGWAALGVRVGNRLGPSHLSQ